MAGAVTVSSGFVDKTYCIKITKECLIVYFDIYKASCRVVRTFDERGRAFPKVGVRIDGGKAVGCAFRVLWAVIMGG